MIDLMGFWAGIITAVSILPQLIKSLKTKKVEGVSLGMFLFYDMGLLLWIAYGYLIWSLPVIVMNGFSFVISVAITGLIIKYR